MDKNLIIKYDIEGEFHERYFYEISFEYNKASNIISLDNTLQEADDFIREIDGWINWMQNRNKNILLEQLLNNENKVIDDLTNSLTRTLKISEQKKFIMSFDAHYKKENYIFLTSTQIYNKIISLI